MLKTTKGRICPKNSSTLANLFSPLNMSNFFVIFVHIEDEELPKNLALNSNVQISGTPHMYCNLKTSKMGKTWHFINSYSKKTKRKLSCNSKSAKIKSKRKITVLPPTKRFFIAI
jgi:hypothetical protein